jgi:hypothetical protein
VSVSAAVDGHANATTCSFEYGTTTAYGSRTAARPLPAAAGSQSIATRSPTYVPTRRTTCGRRVPTRAARLPVATPPSVRHRSAPRRAVGSPRC